VSYSGAGWLTKRKSKGSCWNCHCCLALMAAWWCVSCSGAVGIWKTESILVRLCQAVPLTPIPALSWPTLASCSRAHLEVASCVPLGLLCLHLPFHSFYKGGHALVAEPLARGPTRGMFQLVRSGHLLQKQQTIMVKRQERIYSTSSGVTDVCPSVLSSWNPR
jgi:hypothetical protein